MVVIFEFSGPCGGSCLICDNDNGCLELRGCFLGFSTASSVHNAARAVLGSEGQSVLDNAVLNITGSRELEDKGGDHTGTMSSHRRRRRRRPAPADEDRIVTCGAACSCAAAAIDNLGKGVAQITAMDEDVPGHSASAGSVANIASAQSSTSAIASESTPGGPFAEKAQSPFWGLRLVGAGYCVVDWCTVSGIDGT
jgi:hypothetical protein